MSNLSGLVLTLLGRTTAEHFDSTTESLSPSACRQLRAAALDEEKKDESKKSILQEPPEPWPAPPPPPSDLPLPPKTRPICPFCKQDPFIPRRTEFRMGPLQQEIFYCNGCRGVVAMNTFDIHRMLGPTIPDA